MGQAKQRGTKEQRINKLKNNYSVVIFDSSMPFYQEWKRKGRKAGFNFAFMTILRENEVAIGCCYVNVFSNNGEIKTKTACFLDKKVNALLIGNLNCDIFKKKKDALMPLVIIDSPV